MALVRNELRYRRALEDEFPPTFPRSTVVEVEAMLNGQ